MCKLNSNVSHFELNIWHFIPRPSNFSMLILSRMCTIRSSIAESLYMRFKFLVKLFTDFGAKRVDDPSPLFLNTNADRSPRPDVKIVPFGLNTDSSLCPESISRVISSMIDSFTLSWRPIECDWCHHYTYDKLRVGFSRQIARCIAFALPHELILRESLVKKSHQLYK